MMTDHTPPAKTGYPTPDDGRSPAPADLLAALFAGLGPARTPPLEPLAGDEIRGAVARMDIDIATLADQIATEAAQQPQDRPATRTDPWSKSLFGGFFDLLLELRLPARALPAMLGGWALMFLALGVTLPLGPLEPPAGTQDLGLTEGAWPLGPLDTAENDIPAGIPRWLDTTTGGDFWGGPGGDFTSDGVGNDGFWMETG